VESSGKVPGMVSRMAMARGARTHKRRRMALCVAVAAALATGLAGCSSAAGQPADTAQSSPVATTTYPAHDVPSGTQLKSMLITASSLPSDYAEESAGAGNSGPTLSTAPSTVDLSTAGCATILNVIGHSGFGEASYASDAFTPASDLGEFDETILEFHGAESTSFLDDLRAAFKRCTSFTASDETGDSESVSLALTAGPHLGSDSAAYTVKVGLGGETMVMNGLCIRSGTAVLFLQNSLLQGSPSEINQNTLAAKLLGRLATSGPTAG
jgi:hypothetical protein